MTEPVDAAIARLREMVNNAEVRIQHRKTAEPLRTDPHNYTSVPVNIRHAKAILAERTADKARIAELSARPKEYNCDGLLPCPKCASADGPHLYWWTRGQAWIVICSECKHEEGREAHEFVARDIWNKAAEGASHGQ